MQIKDNENYKYRKTKDFVYLSSAIKNDKANLSSKLVFLHGHTAGYLEDLNQFAEKLRPVFGQIILPYGWYADKKAEFKREIGYLNTMAEGVAPTDYIGPYNYNNHPVIISKNHKWYEKTPTDDSIVKTHQYLQQITNDSKSMETDGNGNLPLPVIGGFFEGGSTAVELILRFGDEFSRCVAINPTYRDVIDILSGVIMPHQKPIFLVVNSDEPDTTLESTRLMAIALEDKGFNVSFEKMSLGLGNECTDELLKILTSMV